MPYRVREILLVSSKYDAFILEEDGPLTEQVFETYSEQSLSWAPRITHISHGLDALEMLDDRRFDLVIAMPRLEDTNVLALARTIKSRAPNLPFVVLTYNEADLDHLPGGLDTQIIDEYFLWTGDARILITINKLIEDARNIDNDSAIADIPAILVVEDSVRHYSTFLTVLYTELMDQSRSLIAEGVNHMQKLLRMRSRPKVLHARTYEEAWNLFQSHRELISAVISDLRFPRNGVLDPEAGLDLIRAIRNNRPELPILIQSAEADIVSGTESRNLLSVQKNSENLHRRLRTFVRDSLGFGDFVFRMPDGPEVARARNMFEMEEVLKTVPSESITYHSMRKHFSMWFTARSMFHIAQQTKPQNFSDPEVMRSYLLDLLREQRVTEQQGRITDFESGTLTSPSSFVRIRGGSIGGKARGVAFCNAMFADCDLPDRFDELKIRVPRTAVVGTAEFDRFIESNRLGEIMEDVRDRKQMLRRFLNGKLSDECREQLRVVWGGLEGPLAVRSSGLLEDLQFQPFSGVYATYMLPNNHPDPDERFNELCLAIKAVYASTFSQNARTYLRSTPFRPEEEKMGVVLQQIVGQQFGSRFYPDFSGVALSYNYYPIEGQHTEEGTALLALGLGQQIVQGGAALRFCPASPTVLPQFQQAFDYVRLSQSEFWAVDLSRSLVDFTAAPESSLNLYPNSAAEQDGTFGVAGSVYSPSDDTVRENLRLEGPRAVTFNNILKWRSIPLAEALSEILGLLRDGMGCPVEVEFAVDMGDQGHATRGDARRRCPTLYVLQVRPMTEMSTNQQVVVQRFDPEELLCSTDKALGHMVREDIRDIVYVKQDAVEHYPTPTIADHVGEINAPLQRAGRPFFLIGPGRWGTSDARLGVPAEWKQIAGAAIIAETRLRDREAEPSLGSHFFGNVTSLGLGYLTLHGKTHDTGGAFIDFAWLDSQEAKRETPAVRHVQLDKPLRAYLDGRRGRATILKPSKEDSSALPKPVRLTGE
jgi:CheY-like chemotaxis protein